MSYPYGSWAWSYSNRRQEALSRYGLRIISGPESEQISLELARAHLRLDAEGSPAEHPDDFWLTEVGIPAAREACESELGRAIAPQTFEIALRGFPGWFPGLEVYSVDGLVYPWAISLPMSPVESILSVKYVDADGNEQTWDPANFILDTWSDVNVIYTATGVSWPPTGVVPNAVKVRYVAGYSLPDDSPLSYPLPKAIKAAMLLMLGHLYEAREATSELKLEEIPLGVSSLLERYRLRLSIA
jgi:uncharacterized phiE125 gp8 family phage protein